MALCACTRLAWLRFTEVSIAAVTARPLQPQRRGLLGRQLAGNVALLVLKHTSATLAMLAILKTDLTVLVRGCARTTGSEN